MTNSLVVDASILLRVVLPGQDPAGAVADALDDLVAQHIELVAPDLLVYEVGQAASRFRASAAHQNAVIPRAMQLVSLVRPAAQMLVSTLAIANEQRLSFNDASYVALAREQGAQLWTADDDILRKCPDVAIDTAALARRTR